MRKVFILSLVFSLTFIKSVFAFDTDELKNCSGIGIKQISISDSLHKQKSPRTEIRGTKHLIEIFGDEKKRYDTKYVYLSDSKELIEDEAIATWYNYGTGRSQYYNLYYQKNDITREMVAGDTVILCEKKNNTFLFIAIKSDSDIEGKLFESLGFDTIKEKQSFLSSLFGFSDDDEAEDEEEEDIKKEEYSKEPLPQYTDTNIKILLDTETQRLVVFGKVEKIMDGDTLAFNRTLKVRLVGLDAPEKKQFCKDNKGEEFNCGTTSTDFLKKLIGKGNVSCENYGAGGFGRELYVCYNSRGVNINEAIVKNGYAPISSHKPILYTEQEQQAKDEKLGLWAGEFEHPEDWRANKRKKK